MNEGLKGAIARDILTMKSIYSYQIDAYRKIITDRDIELDFAKRLHALSMVDNLEDLISVQDAKSLSNLSECAHDLLKQLRLEWLQEELEKHRQEIDIKKTIARK